MQSHVVDDRASGLFKVSQMIAFIKFDEIAFFVITKLEKFNLAGLSSD